MIQILGLREYTCPRTGTPKKKEAFFDKGWGARSVQELFLHLDKIMEPIPEGERYNLYYTAAYCEEDTSRVMVYQDVIPFDIDDIDHDQIGTYISACVEVLNVPYAEMGIVATGNGLQIIIGLDEPFDDQSFFDKNRIQYKGVAELLQNRLLALELPGKVDTSVFSHARLLRLPATRNVKPDKGDKPATLIQANIVPQRFDLAAICGIPHVKVSDQINPSMLERLPPPDTKGVLEGCDFLKWCKENQEDVSEPQWYAMLSIVGRLDHGNELAHEFSRHHPQYNGQDTDTKLEQALASSGPRTCDSIDFIWDGCKTCPNYGKCKSPITLKSEEYIKTKDTGFYFIEIGKDGLAKKGKPDYHGLMRYLEQETPFVTLQEGSMTLKYTGTHWEDLTLRMIEHFAESNFNPPPNNAMCSEFRGKLLRNNLVEPEFFSTEGTINFKNGVLNLDTMELVPHTMKMGFKYCLPFAYDPTASCTRFNQFLDEVTLNDKQLQVVLLEFMGYALSGMDAAIGQKALILTGDGSNGKSVFMDVLKYLAGKNNYATLSMGYEINKLENRYQLDGKLFNVSEETPTNSMMDSTVFKALVAGGEVQARKLYCDAYSMKNNAKLIMACNELPSTKDLSHGMFRRLLIAPFNAKFSPDDQGYDPMVREKLYAEAPGIMNLCLEHLATFRKAKVFSKCDSINSELDDYMNDNADIQHLIEDVIVDKRGKYVAVMELYKMYTLDCETSNEKPRPYKNFCRRMKTIYPKSRFKRQMHQGKKQLIITDVGIREAEEPTNDF